MLVDVTPSQEMVDEGIAREVVNKIQKLRKKVGFLGRRGEGGRPREGEREGGMEGGKRREGRRKGGWEGGMEGRTDRLGEGRMLEGRREGQYDFGVVSSTGRAAATRSSGGGVRSEEGGRWRGGWGDIPPAYHLRTLGLH